MVGRPWDGQVRERLLLHYGPAQVMLHRQRRQSFVQPGWQPEVEGKCMHELVAGHRLHNFREIPVLVEELFSQAPVSYLERTRRLDAYHPPLAER
jgi:hypothetical protein